MNFGLNFGILRSASGFVAPPSEIDPADWYINESVSTGTYDLLQIENGFEIEFFADGTATTLPIALNILTTSIPAVTDVRYYYTIELLSGVNPIAYQVIVSDDIANKFEVSAGSYVFDYTTTNTTTYSGFYLNETVAGKVRITNTYIEIL